MGIEVFFSTLTESYGNIIKTINEPEKIKATYLFIDFNSIVHTISAKMISKTNNLFNIFPFRPHQARTCMHDACITHEIRRLYARSGAISCQKCAISCKKCTIFW